MSKTRPIRHRCLAHVGGARLGPDPGASLNHSSRQRQRLAFAALLIAALLSHTGAASAEPDIEQARRLFEEASTLREAGHFADALVRLKLAIAIKDTPGLEYHAGFCEAKLGHYVNAIDHYERAAALIRAGVAAPDVVVLLNQAHKSALEQVGHLRIGFAKPVSGVLLRVDDQAERPLTGHEIALDPGKHHLLVRAPGYTSQEREITLGAAEEMRVDFELAPVHKDDPGTKPLRADTSIWRTTSIGTALGVTALGLTTGIVGAIGHSNAASSEQAARAGGQTQSARLAAAQQDQRTYATLETVGFVSAGVGAVATVALWTLWPTAKPVSVATTSTEMGRCSAHVLLTTTF